MTSSRSDDLSSAPIVRDADGWQQPYAPLYDHAGVLAGWTPDPDLAPGDYTVHAPPDVDAWNGVTSFEVLPYGVGEGFDATRVAGRTYRLTMVALGDPAYFAGFQLAPVLEDVGVFLQVLDADATTADFRIVYDEGAQPRCEVLRGEGTISPQGRLEWAVDSVTMPTTPMPTSAYDLALSLGFLADGSAAGGVHAALTLDVGPLTAHMSDLCGTTRDYGAACWDCTGDGAQCITMGAYAGVFDASSEALPDELPPCAVDLAETGEALSCDGSGGLCAAGIAPPFLLLAAVRRRRLHSTR
jgi:hypothetical protein